MSIKFEEHTMKEAVEAAAIKDIKHADNNGKTLYFDGKNEKGEDATVSLVVDADFVARNPELAIGGFYVKHDSGHTEFVTAHRMAADFIPAK